MENSYGLYVGNLTWWTTDQDVTNAINSTGVNDVQEVKFFENRINGQSKGFCVVTFDSEASLPIVMEKLPKFELYGQNPVVTPYNRQNLSLFESQTKTRPQISSNNGPNSHAAGIMGISSISGVHAGTQGLSAYGQAGPGVGGAGLGVTGGGLVGARAPSWPVDGWSGNQHHHTGMMPRLPMRAPRPVGMRGSLPGAMMNNGPTIPGGHHMNWVPRFTPPQPAWNNFQQRGDDSRSMRREDGPSLRRDDGLSVRRDEGLSIRRDEGSSLRRDEGSSIRRDEGSSSLRREEGSSSRRDEGSSSSRRDEGSSSRREEGSSSRREEGSSSRREEGSSSSSRREERREERSRREESSREKSSRREKSHRSDDRGRSRSRDRSRERKERRERKGRY